MKAFLPYLLLSLITFSLPASASSDENYATNHYITQVLRMSRVLQRSGAVTVGHIAVIFDRTAEKIEDLDITNVREDAVDWGLDAARRLRNAGLMIRDIGMRASVAGDSYRTTYQFQYWGYYYSYWQRTYRSNYARRVATYDAARFKFEQYHAIRAKGVQLRRQLQ